MHIDLTYLTTVSGGDQQFIKEILELYLANTLPDAHVLKQKIDDQEWDAAASAAHKIKSSVTMLGNTIATELVTRIEHSAKSKSDLGNLEGLYKRLEKEMDLMSESIKGYLSSTEK